MESLFLLDWKKEMKEDIEEVSHLRSVACLLRLLDLIWWRCLCTWFLTAAVWLSKEFRLSSTY